NQIGNGEGNYQIQDSLIKINSTSYDTQNSIIQGNPTEHNTSFSTDNSLTNFSLNSQDFYISNVSAKEDWRLIENEIADVDPRNSLTYIEVAQEFEINDNYANITKVEVYIKYIDLSKDGQYPQGSVSIFNDSSGEPDTLLGTSALEEKFGDPPLDLGIPVGPAWPIYSFPEPISVTKGSYWLVLNDTGNQSAGYWEWYSQDDQTNEDAGDMLAKGNHGDSWVVNPFPQGDILSTIRVLSTDQNGNNLTYSSPNEISMTYNTSDGNYELSSFLFKANDTSIHNLYTNTSVSFTLQSIENFSFSSFIITPNITYHVHNGSDSLWNLSFSTTFIDTVNIIRNRTISINGIPTDWNGSNIYWNNSSTPEYADLTNNVNVTWDGDPDHKYTSGNTTMVINASILSSSVTWYVCFNASNYISDFHLERNSLPLSLPISANVTDTLNLLYSVEESEGNASFWIEYNPISTQILTNTNISYSDKIVSYSWDVNSTLDQHKNINGTYDLQAFWINLDKNKVGTSIRKIDLFINTSFDVQTDTEMIIGEPLTISAFYKSIHNETDVKNARIWCDASWPSAIDTFMNQISADQSYNATFDTSGITPGTLGNITVITYVSWFTNWTKIVHINFVENATLAINPPNLVLEWRENISLRLDYHTIIGTPILNALVQVNGSYAYYNDSISAYSYKLNSTDFTGVGSYTDIPVTVIHSDYLSRQLNFSFIIIPGTTNLTGMVNGEYCLNKTEFLIPFANGSADTLDFNLQYFHTQTNDNLTSIEPYIESLIPHISSLMEVDTSWTLTFNPNQTGRFVINITFSLTNYRPVLFILNLNIEEAQTEIQINFVNALEVYYSEFFEFSAFFLNTDWDENITFSNYESIEINDETHLQFLNRTEEFYWFRFSATQISLGLHTIQVSFSHPQFETGIISVVFTVVEMPTLEISASAVHLSNNGSIMVEDTLSITIDDYRTIREINIISLNDVDLWLNDTPVPAMNILDLQLSHAPFSLNLSTIGWQYGSYNLTIKISTFGCQAQIYSQNITLLGLPVNVVIEVEPGKNIRQGEDIIFSATMAYPAGFASDFRIGSLGQFSTSGIEITFYIILQFENDSTQIFNETIPIDESGEARYTIYGSDTIDAIGFANITITSSAGISALPAAYVMTASELADFEIIPPPINIIGVIINVLIIVTICLITAFVSGTVFRVYRRRRNVHKSLILRNDKLIEESFEDIKSIRLILVRHFSGLPIYAEKTVAEFQADTDALSGMSTAISQFIEDVSESMVSRNDNGTPREKFESISREGFHMLIWNGRYTSLLIISETHLPEYFMERLYGIGNELEERFEKELQDFLDIDNFPQPTIKKIIRKYLSLHYFSAFVLNEGILTLKNIKLSKKDRKMLSLIKEATFEKQGNQYFFSEQVISYLATKYKRSEAIKFLEKAIEFNLLVECSQEEMLQLGQ
ncbi:MAG: hypothetical protein ACW97Z_16995, partial [Candidatus Hodarchaeales archaeon]